MYRLSFTRLLNNSSLMFTKNSTSTLCNLQKHNLKPVNSIPQGTLVNNYRIPFSGNRLKYTNNDGYDHPFSALAKAYEEHGRVQAHSVLNILGQHNVDFFNIDQSLLLLQCCGQALVDKSPSLRSTLCNQVWAKIEESDMKLDLQHYNKYLEVCIENKTNLDYVTFLSTMKNCQPNEATYYLLLYSACQLGDVPQAIKIISEMKHNNFSADEKVFNALVLGNAIKGGLNDAVTILTTMQITRIPPTTLTYYYLLRGVAERNSYQEFLKALELHPGGIDEEELLKLFHVLGLHGNHTWISEVLKKLKLDVLSNSSLSQLNLLCIHLIHMGQSEAAFYYYKKFAIPHIIQAESKSLIFLFVEMLSSGVPTKQVMELIKGLSEFDYIDTIQRVTEIVLRRGLTDAAWELLAEFQCLRPHYFWPLLLKAANIQRENGIFDVISKMIKIGTKPDMDTLEFYIIPYCDVSDPKSLLLRLKHLGFSYKELLTPILCYLLKEDQIVAAQRLCSISENIFVEPEKLLQPLCRAWINKKNSSATVVLLKRMCNAKEDNEYVVGKFLPRLFRMCKTPADYNHFLELIKMMNNNNMKISTTSADSIFYYLKTLNHRTLSKSIHKAIEAITNNDFHDAVGLIPHPRNMTPSEQENLLIELQNKGMETRGILRKLIQNHCRLGNEKRVNELRQQFLDAGYEETAGMKAGLFHTYVNTGNENSAMNIYNEIRRLHSNFTLDDFKVVDFATLLTQRNNFNDALKVLSDSRTVRGGPDIVRNCWQLLGATSDESHMESLFKLLVEKGYCVPSNIILGPFVKIHLNRGDIKKAVEVYTECAKKYKCTPLQVELLCTVVEVENEELLSEVLNTTAKVHGSDAAGISLISALSQAGLHKSLRKFLLEMNVIPKQEIIKLCDRWLQCKDVLALETLSTAFHNFPLKKFDAAVVYNYLIQMHGLNNDCESAVKFYRELLDLKVKVPETVTQELLRMVHRCNYIVSEDLLKEQIRL